MMISRIRAGSVEDRRRVVVVDLIWNGKEAFRIHALF